MPYTSEVEVEELVKVIAPAAPVLPIVLPVVVPRLASPEDTSIPLKGEEVLVPEIAPLTAIAVIIFPCILVAVVVPCVDR